MSKHRLRARLDRVQRRASTAKGEERDRTRDFAFDPAAAKALRDETAQLWDLASKTDSVTPADLAEQARLRESIAARERSFSCPAGYGELQTRADNERSRFLFGRRMAHHYGGTRMTKAEDAEEAQVVARLAAYRNSPEHHARRRISELRWKRDGRTANEETELEELVKRYPDLPPDPDDPMAAMHKRFSEGLEKAMEAEDARMAPILKHYARVRWKLLQEAKDRETRTIDPDVSSDAALGSHSSRSSDPE